MPTNCLTCGAANDPEADTCFKCGRGLFSLVEGSLLSGRYEILLPLGKGGMGSVYKAHDRELDEVVAVKVLRTDTARNPDLARRFRAEIKLARKIRHRNVCAIHEYGQEGHLSYIVMEYVAGIDLRRILRQQGPLGFEEAFDAAEQMAIGLHAIHEMGIIHRDLKTPNIMRDERGLIRLMDFGIAKQLGTGPGSETTATGQIVGTPEYMSPEQVRAERLDARSDLYALGIVIFEVFTGDVPFRGDTPLATLLKQVQEPPRFGEQQPSRIPAPLVPVLDRVLSKERERRYASALEMLEAIRTARAACQEAFRQHPFPPEATGSLALAEPATEPTTASATPVPTPVPTYVRTVVTHPERADETWRIPDQRASTGGRPPMVGKDEPPPRASRVGTVSARSRATGTTRVVTAVVALGVALAYAAWELRRERAVPDPPSTSPARTEPSDGRARDVAPPQSPVRIEPSPPPSAPAATSSPPPGPVSQGTAAAPIAPPGRRDAPAGASTSPRRDPGTGAATPVRGDAGVTATPRPPHGYVRILVFPWAEISIDGKSVGTTPLPAMELPPGEHVVRISHPEYRTFQRVIKIKPGETLRLEVDLRQEAFPTKD